MTLHRPDRNLDLDPDREPSLLSRRTVVRRSFLGITGVSLASLLAACGGDDEDVPVDGGPAEDPVGEDPIGEDPDEDTPTEPAG